MIARLETPFEGSFLESVSTRRKPRRMDRMLMPKEHARLVSKLATEIFTDMANVGAPFHECLAAIYLSGFENAVAARKEPNQ